MSLSSLGSPWSVHFGARSQGLLKRYTTACVRRCGPEGVEYDVRGFGDAFGNTAKVNLA